MTHTKYFLSFANHCKIDRDNSLLRKIAPGGEINEIAEAIIAYLKWTIEVKLGKVVSYCKN